MKSNLKGLSILELTNRLESVDPFSEEAMHIHDGLLEAVEGDILCAFESLSMPFYRVSDTAVIGVHPSSKNGGMIQVTRYSLNDGIYGDSQYTTLRSAIQSEGVWFKDRLDQESASQFMKKVIAAEEMYQARMQSIGLAAA